MTRVSAALRELSEPWPSGEKVKTAIGRASRLSGLTYWRTFDLWYGKARRIEDFEIVKIEDALAKKREEAARHELTQLKLQLTRLESLLASKGPDFYRPELTNQLRLPLREVGGKDGGSDCPMD